MDNTSKLSIISALDKSETINVRGERFIPLSKLKRNLESRFVSERDFSEFMYKLTDDREYIKEVIQRLFHTPIEELGEGEKFKITSAYYV